MVCDNLETHIVAILVIDLARQLLYFANDWHEEVGLKVGLSPLDDSHQTLQTCARINVLMWQFLVLATWYSRVSIEL